MRAYKRNGPYPCRWTYPTSAYFCPTVSAAVLDRKGAAKPLPGSFVLRFIDYPVVLFSARILDVP